MIEVAKVVVATGASIANVHASWPVVYAALSAAGIGGELTQVAAIATIAVECPPFKPIAEYGEHPEYDTGHKAAMLGNTPAADGDGQKYEGRGFIQITGRSNYKAYGDALGVNLIEKPDLALSPIIAARILARYFATRGVSAAAELRNWRRVRLLVNGGYNGWERFAAVIHNLGEKV